MKITADMPEGNRPLVGTATPEDAAAWLRIPSTLSRRAATLLPWLILLADDRGLVPRARLRTVLEGARGEEPMRHAITDLVHAGLIIRTPTKQLKALGVEVTTRPGAYLTVVWGRVYSAGWKQCLNCIRPVKPVRGSRYCATCQATVARQDRSWKALAFERWVQGRARVSANGNPAPETESAIAFAIHRATNVPLYTRRRNVGDDDAADEGVINFMIRMGFFVGDEWARIAAGFAAPAPSSPWPERMRNHAQGNEGEE